MTRALRHAAPLTLLFVLGCAGPGQVPCELWPGYTPPAEVAASLTVAGENARDLEATLVHYAGLGDEQKLAAAEFLIANMPGQGFARYELVDADGTVVPYEALDHGNYDGALAALDALEAEHGSLDFQVTEFVPDLEVITSAYLVDSIEAAFQAWRGNPWSQDVTFEAFRDHVLPYRGSNEPLEPWRRAVAARFADVQAELAETTEVRTAAARVNREVGRWVGFDSIFYLHPTDQSYAEMTARRQGRCEDITNMNTYAMRANALPSAADYTPFWADRDNNHAWPVVLDANGEGHAGLSHRAAKVFRKTFALQRSGLAFQLGEGEEAPPWLDRKHFIDVTSQYFETVELSPALTVEPPAASTHAYLAVFNGGAWKAIAWAPLVRGASGPRATFTDMGPDVLYLPAYFAGGELVPAGAPFFVGKAPGFELTTLDGSGGLETCQLVATGPYGRDEAGDPVLQLKAGATYDLYHWSDAGWGEPSSLTVDEFPVQHLSETGGHLYWLVERGSRQLERPFLIADGEQVFH